MTCTRFTAMASWATATTPQEVQGGPALHKDLAGMLIDQYGPDAEFEARCRSSICQKQGDESGHAAWQRIAGAIQEIADLTPTGRLN